MKTFWLLIAILAFTSVQSQSKLLIQNSSGEVIIYNVEDKIRNKIYQSFDKLMGYNLSNDTLINLYFEERGHITVKKVVLPIPIITIDTTFFEANLSNMFNVNSVYIYKNYKLVASYDDQHIKFYKDNVFQWDLSDYSPAFGIASSGFGYLNPQLSSDLNYLLFHKLTGYILKKPKSTIVEINVASGLETEICKNCFYPSYSFNSKYILFKKKWSIFDKYYIFDKSKQTYSRLGEDTFESFKQAYWLK